MHTQRAHVQHPFHQRLIGLMALAMIWLTLVGTAEANGPREHRPGYPDRGYTQGPGYGVDHDTHRYGHAYDREHNHRRGHARYDAWQAERRERARRYAERAVEQAREARWYGYRFDHPRWSTRYKRHFRWALHAHPRELRRETRVRERRLTQIRHSSSWPAYGAYPGYGPRHNRR
ncbi:MAG: hypothetical protein AAGH65_00465 [Pseudomonadota bacterium]